MNFYEIALLKSPLSPLTYQSEIPLNNGQIVQISLRNRKKELFGVILTKVEKPSFKCTSILKISDTYYDDQILTTAKFIATYYVCSIGEALSLYKGFYKVNHNKESNLIPCDISLSKIQEEALSFTSKNRISLLFANTGSGKTEIYIKAIQKHLNNNKQAVLLMPEISLTPQMQKRLEKVFDKSVAIWHSKIQNKKKNEILEGLLKGDIKIIAGARSSLFLPFHNLGIIIVDEEHDESYKADAKPRLNVKDLAMFMSKKFDIQVILGSATPSISSFFKVPYIRVKETFHQTSKTLSFDDSNLSLSQKVVHKIQNTLLQNKQVIVFLPTRANFKYQICSDCGTAVECPFCSVSLSLHKNHKALKCHYCNYTQSIPEFCPTCTVGVLKNYRLGTSEVKAQLLTLFENNIIQTFDRDSVKTTTQLKKILKEFNEQKIDILVGTQMLSKGHDYHNVTLAVILGIDSVLNMTSYKVREKALSLAIQIAGRSGRNGEGEVLIQTKDDEFFNTYMHELDYEDFLKEELECRADIYPPKIRLARVVFSHQNAFIAKEHLDKYVNILLNNQEVELVGFKECSVFKIANKYRYELVVRSKNTKKLLEFLHYIECPFAAIDMDTLH